MAEERFPDVPCELCTTPAQLNTVPLRLIPAGSPPWQVLCDTCFRQELGLEPWDSLKMRPVRHDTRGRR
jgi:hypothetical protein